MSFRREFYESFTESRVPDHTGNPLTDYGLGLLILSLQKDFLDLDASIAAETLRRMEMGHLWAKKFNGDGTLSPDEITKDDIIGLLTMGVAGAKYSLALYGIPAHIVNVGMRTGWCLSNTGEPYPSAFARPWDVALYTLIADRRPTLWDHALLVGQIVVDALITKPNDPSSKRLMYMGLWCVAGKSAVVDLAATFWTWRIGKRYGGLPGILAAYHGKDSLYTRGASQ